MMRWKNGVWLPVLAAVLMVMVVAIVIFVDDAIEFVEVGLQNVIPHETESYIYQTDNNRSIKGLPFLMTEADIRQPPYFVDLKKYDLTNFTFITAASSNHFEESKDLIGSIQKFFPKKKIYYYDIGLEATQIEQIESWCNVIYIKWNRRPYPNHARKLNSYAFKPLILYDALLVFDAVFWLDSSARLSPGYNHSDWSSLYRKVIANDGIVQFDPTGRDIYQCTAKGMYGYLPTDEEQLKHIQMLGANEVLLYRTEIVFNKIVHWWRLCALTKGCIQPAGHKLSCGKQAVPGVSICHRYDQSALGILVANLSRNNKNMTMVMNQPILQVHRHPTKFYVLLTNC